MRQVFPCLLLLIGTTVRAESGADDSLTLCGVTLYGVVDLGLAYQTHGVPLNRDYYIGLEYVVSKNSNHSQLAIAPGGLGQSKIGIKGTESITGDWDVVFRLETDFNPESLRLADSSKAMVANSDRPLALQNSNSDGNKNGQIFAGAAYAGLGNRDFGTLTFGRQTSLIADALMVYDPQSGAYAFSFLGIGAPGGGGSTQNVRMDDSLKYTISLGDFHGGLFNQFVGADGYGHGALQGDLGYAEGPLNVDFVASRVKDTISASPLNPAQAADPKIPGNSLAATVSDTTAVGAMAKYAFADVTLFGGTELIEFANPSHPLLSGFSDEGGYRVSAAATNNRAYDHKRNLAVFWTGVRYPINEVLSLSGGYYRTAQNNYRGDGCAGTAFPQCKGWQHALGGHLEYRLARRWDAYAGAMYTEVGGGMASGFLHRSNLGPMVGTRFSF